MQRLRRESHRCCQKCGKINSLTLYVDLDAGARPGRLRSNSFPKAANTTLLPSSSSPGWIAEQVRVSIWRSTFACSRGVCVDPGVRRSQSQSQSQRTPQSTAGASAAPAEADAVPESSHHADSRKSRFESDTMSSKCASLLLLPLLLARSIAPTASPHARSTRAAVQNEAVRAVPPSQPRPHRDRGAR